MMVDEARRIELLKRPDVVKAIEDLLAFAVRGRTGKLTYHFKEGQVMHPEWQEVGTAYVKV